MKMKINYRVFFILAITAFLFSETSWPPELELEVEYPILSTKGDDITLKAMVTNKSSQDTLIIKKIIIDASYLKGVFVHKTIPNHKSVENMNVKKEDERLEVSYLDIGIDIPIDVLEEIL